MLKFAFLIVPLLLISSAVQAQSIPNLSVRDRQRLSRDLTPSNSQEFFNLGHNQLEREIRLLERRFTAQQESPLRIDPKLRDQEFQSDSIRNRVIPKMQHLR
ncbi:MULTISPECIES: hypothetical protein [Leptolyngbya]|jgi:hypothetical protein|uniref:Uncharacterized protein n=2 Tax=Leptolyngbya boryana TaxID=1184 RepID=A0A1Z4JHW6_LEPBY|nr:MULTISPECIES: hypothetical protein [Leptolyngbya]BAY56326.1 hypothetical protein NIES2135_31570 [Leptolyngbya boryana NIES-2135]MBD1854947.1 hypothetical protein [Leptolyngbya sp. FACHB-1624]MBD2366433.1 hypothetical protein [Leptolyngbya sp. FACHB-161]MBD2372612.1 hypothetical protein [Leptolyngbya sp. FACHB-238]MBD2397035.1 hypothetical protein [Leptolyngbya sp. FACHB-239]